MTDTPPFYWLNGEDGPVEEDDGSEALYEKDGALTAPRKLQNGLLEKINLSRSLDRQRRSGAASTMGATMSFDGIAARNRGKAPVSAAPQLGFARSQSSTAQPRRSRTASSEDALGLGVDIFGMPGGGLRPPAPLIVPGLRPVMPASGEGPVVGVPAHALAANTLMVGAASMPPAATAAGWPFQANVGRPAPVATCLSRWPSATRAATSNSVQLAQHNVSAARSPSSPPLGAAIRAAHLAAPAQGASGTSWHWSEASSHVSSMRSQSLSRVREPSPVPGTGALNMMEMACTPVSTTGRRYMPDLSGMSGKSTSQAFATEQLHAPSAVWGPSRTGSRGNAMRCAGINPAVAVGNFAGRNQFGFGGMESFVQEPPSSLGEASNRGRSASPLQSRAVSPILWPGRNATPPASPSASWNRPSQVPPQLDPMMTLGSQGTSRSSSFLLPSWDNEKCNVAGASPASCSGTESGHWPWAQQHTINVAPQAAVYGSMSPATGAGTSSAQGNLTPPGTPSTSYVPSLPPGSSLLPPARVRPRDPSPQTAEPDWKHHDMQQDELGKQLEWQQQRRQQRQEGGVGEQGLPETPIWAQPTSMLQNLAPDVLGTEWTQPQLRDSGAERPRVLVTGATGLLGRQVMQAFDDLEVRGLCQSRGKPPMVSCDLTAEGVAAKQIEEFRPHIVIHLAGEHRPDVLRRSPARARLLNVDASGAIAAACECVGSWLIMMSADAVFDGSSPPYAIDDSPNPLSEYGWHKLHAEKLVLAACPGAAVVRVPMLYGGVEFAAESVVTSILAEMRTKVTQQDNRQRCYPTWAADVARVLRTLADMHLGGADLRGIFHWQGDECFTRYEMACVIAEICSLDAPEASVGTWDWSLVPEDACLDCSRLEELLAAPMTGLRRYRTSFREGLGVCLAPFLSAHRRVDLAGQAPHGSKEVKFISDATLHVDGGLPVAEQKGNSMLPDASQATSDTEEPFFKLLGNAPRAPHDSKLGVPPAPTKQRPDVESKSSFHWEEWPESRAAALKTVFREELEHAWRRYRDAARDK